MKIFKYELPAKDRSIIELPVGAMILDCQVQSQSVMLWAIVDPDAEKEKRTFEFVVTGGEVTMQPREYVATVQYGRYVFHIFEVNPLNP
jgi:hypothetical protein